MITTLSLNEGTAARGALLSAVYALGLGLPFIVAGVAYERMLGAVRFVRRHQEWVTRFGGLMMIAVGVLLLTGWWDEMVTWVQLHLVRGLRGERVSTDPIDAVRDPLLGQTPAGPERQPGELGAVELARWAWRQLTSMRTALVLLLLLALAAIPGSVIPQDRRRLAEDLPVAGGAPHADAGLRAARALLGLRLARGSRPSTCC